MQTVLLIEDDAELREDLRDGLAAVGYRVIEAANGVDGMVSIQERLPDLVITDICMPDKEGIEVLLTIQKHASPVPVIVISGYPEYLDFSRKLGAAQTLLKPFRMRQLLDCIDDALAR